MDKTLRIIIIILLLAWLSLFLFSKINLTTADLGRHIKNGELILKGETEVLNTNYYSYTNPDYPFLNHHWGAGIIFFLVSKIGGIFSVHLLYILLFFASFLLLFLIAEKKVGTETAALISLLIIPLIAYREEVRPEIFTYFFSSLFFYILWNNKKKHIIPVLQLIWVNTHIYFVFGPALIAGFLIQRLINKKKIKDLVILLIITSIVCLINPFGFRTITYPFTVLNNYGYRIVENQSIKFLEDFGLKDPTFLLFKIVFCLMIISFILLILKKKKISFVNACLGIGLGIMSIFIVRNISMFGLFALPILAVNMPRIRFKTMDSRMGLLAGSCLIIIFILSFYAPYLPMAKNTFGLGLIPNNNASMEFFKEHDIQGPIFNNYDIGGYLIYHSQKVYVDNRPEAYPSSFFNETYIPKQQKSEVDEFNTIFFYYRDMTNWAQVFLKDIVKNPEWVPVYVDDFALILLKRNELNKQVIEQYELPEQTFK